MAPKPAEPCSATDTQPAPAAAAAEGSAVMRLNRFLARAGVASRRGCDALIQEGSVRVNGVVVVEPGVSVDTRTDVVACRGRIVRLPETNEYVVFHKPRGCLVTRRDHRGRKTIYEFLAELRPGTVAVGRLDQDTTGLLLLTDDGELAFRLMHPRYAVDKVYEATVIGVPDQEALDQLRRGVELEDGMTAPAKVDLLDIDSGLGGRRSRIRLCIHEGRKRQVRRMLRAVGHPVERLHRVAFGGLELDLATPGTWRHLTSGEVEGLKALVGLAPPE